VNKDGKRIGELHSKGRFVVGIGSIHEKGTRYTLKGRTNEKMSLKFDILKEFQSFLKERNIFTTPWGKTGIENIQNLELFVAKPQLTYQQKKEQLEKSTQTSKKPLNICYICLVSFAKDPPKIKSHLESKNHLAKLKIYRTNKNSKRSYSQPNGILGEN
jgi:hypothetical protein